MAEKVPTRADQGQKVAYLLIVGYSIRVSLNSEALHFIVINTEATRAAWKKQL